MSSPCFLLWPTPAPVTILRSGTPGHFLFEMSTTSIAASVKGAQTCPRCREWWELNSELQGNLASGLSCHQGCIILGRFVPSLGLSSSFVGSVGWDALWSSTCRRHWKQRVHVGGKREQRLAWGIQIPHLWPGSMEGESLIQIHYHISSVMTYPQVSFLLSTSGLYTSSLPQTLLWLFKGFKSPSQAGCPLFPWILEQSYKFACMIYPFSITLRWKQYRYEKWLNEVCS